MERRKSRESNTVLRTKKGNTVGHSKSQESNNEVRTVRYADILRRNILPSYSIDAHNVFIISRLTTCYLCAPEPIFPLVPYL